MEEFRSKVAAHAERQNRAMTEAEVAEAKAEYRRWMERQLAQTQSELTAAKAENEALRGRVAELEHLIRYAQVESGVCMCGDEIESHNQASGHNPVDIWDHAAEKALEGTSDAWLLRKQAEAVEAALSDDDTALFFDREYVRVQDFEDYAQRLRQQAEAAEKGGDDG